MTNDLKIWLFNSSKGLSMIADMQANIQSQTFAQRSNQFLPGDKAARTATPTVKHAPIPKATPLVITIAIASSRLCRLSSNIVMPAGLRQLATMRS
jgi:hypothetical protein